MGDDHRGEWPLVTLNLDFKTNETEHHAFVLALLRKHEAWLTTAVRTPAHATPTPREVGPMLVLTGSNDQQQVTFHDTVPVGEKLLLFGAINTGSVPGATPVEKAIYTLNGDDRKPAGGYNFGSSAAALARWHAAIDAKTDFVATDQYEEFARVRAAKIRAR